MSSLSSPVAVEKRAKVGWITLNRPASLNAINRQLDIEFRDGMSDLTQDDNIAVIVLVGAGGKAFSTGYDLKETARYGRLVVGQNRGGSSISAVEACTKPVIAAIDGYCVSGGLELACVSDIRIATEQSTFGLFEVRRGMLPGPGVHELTRIIPLGEALWLQLTGRTMDSRRAYEVGLIQMLLPSRSALMREAEQLASDIALGAPLSLEGIKQVVKTGRNLPVEYSRKLAEPVMQRIQLTEDFKEGPRAFSEKRPPVWKRR